MAVLKDPDTLLCHVAADALREIDPTKAVEALQRLARDDKRRTFAVSKLIDLVNPRWLGRSSRELAALTRLFVKYPESIAGLLQMLDASYPSCEAAAQILLHMGASVRETLLEVFARSEAKRRETVARALAIMGWVPTYTRQGALYWICLRNWNALSRMGAVAVEPLVGVVRDAARSVEDRENALGALAQTGDPCAVQEAITMLNGPEASLRKTAIETLGRLGDACAVKPLVAALKSHDQRLRRAVTNALGEFSDPTAISALRKVLADKDGLLQQAAERSLHRLFPASKQTLCDALVDSQPTIRAAAARALAHPGNAQCVDALISLLSDEDARVKESAAYALGKIGDRRAVATLSAVLLEPTESTAHLYDALVWEFPELHERLEDHNPQSMAAWALGELGDGNAAAALRQAYADAAPFVRAGILSAIAKLDPEGAIDLLIEGLHQEAIVCRAAALALGSLGVERAAQPLCQAMDRLGKSGIASFDISQAYTAVAEAMAKCGRNTGVELLAASLRVPDRTRRTAVVRALGQSRHANAIAPLVDFLRKNLDREEQAAVFAALKDIGKSAVQALEDLLFYRDYSPVQEQAAQSLGEIGDATVFESLSGLALDQLYSAPSARLAAVRSLVGLDADAASAVLQEVLKNEPALSTATFALAKALRRARISPPITSSSVKRDEENEDNRSALRLEVVLSLGLQGHSEIIGELIAALKHEQPQVRERAANALGQCTDPRSLDPLLVGLRDWHPDVRAAAASAVGALRDKHAVRPLRELLEDDDAGVRQQAAAALDAFGWRPRRRAELASYRIAKGEWERCAEIGAAAVQPLARVIEDRDRGVRAMAVAALGRCRETEAQSVLLRASRSARSDVRVHALDALVGHAGAVVDEAFLECLRRDPDQHVRLAALKLLRRRGTKLSVGTLILLLDTSDPQLRCAAIAALGESRDAAAVEPLTAAINDADSEVKLAALGALGNLHVAQALGPLRSVLEEATHSTECRAAAAAALGRSCDIDAVEPLVGQLIDENAAIREAAAGALRTLADENTLGAYVFMFHLGTSQASVREVLASALGRLPVDVDLHFEPDPSASLANLVHQTAERAIAGRRLAAALACYTSTLQRYRATIDQADADRDLVQRAAEFCFRLGVDGVKLFVDAGAGDCAGATVHCVLNLAQSLGNAGTLWETLAEACKTLARAGDDAITLDAYQQAVSLVEDTWFMQPDDETSLRNFFRDKSELYDGLALCYQRLGAPAEAWQILEAAKTRYLGDLIMRRQTPPVESYARVTEDRWAAVRHARAHAVGRSKDAPAGLKELVGVEPAKADEASITVPQHRQALCDALRDEGMPDKRLMLVDELWNAAGALVGHPLAPSVREALKPVRRFIDEMLLRPIDAPTQRYFDLFHRSDESLRELRVSITPIGLRFPIDALESRRGFWADLAGTEPPYEEALVLEFNALREILNLICGEGKVFAEMRPRSAGEPPPAWRGLFQTGGKAGSRQKLIQEAGRHLADAWERVEESRWQQLTRLARGQPSSFAALRAYVSRELGSAVVSFHVTRDGTIAYLFRAAPQQNSLLPTSSSSLTSETMLLPEFGLTELETELNQNWLEPLRMLRAPDLGDENEKRARGRLDHLLGWIYERLLQSIDRRLRAWGIRRVLFIPHRGLHLLPLHACWYQTPSGRRYLMDRYEVVYAPSFTLFEIGRARKAGRTSVPPRLFAYSDPNSDLVFAAEEVKQVAHFFHERTCTTSPGELQEVGSASHIHFSCHGRYDFSAPLQSGLDLGGNAWLSLGDLFADVLPLSGAPQVVLSACESGLVSAADLADEYFGIASGFLFAGASSVVSTLWAVNDLASMLLMERFYDYQLRYGLCGAAALRKAQIWLRDAVSAEWLCTRFSNAGKQPQQSALPTELLEELRAHFFFMDPKARPFAHLYDWAACALSGMP